MKLTPALDRVGDDARGFAGFGGPGQSVGEFGEVVAVHDAHGPAERAPFFVERFVAADVAGMAGDLQRVVVNDGREVVEVVMRAAMAASQFEPSASSPSPSRVKTR